MIRHAGILLVAATLLAGGCTSQFKRIETNTDQTLQAQRDLEAQFADMKSVIESIREGEAAREADYLELRAQMENQLRQLQSAVRTMDARSAEQQALLREVLAALDIIARQPVGAVGDSLSVSQAAVPGGSPGKDVFDAAYADYTRGDYALARDGFQEVVDRFGRSELADDAEYWVAETWYAEGDYTRAVSGFQSMIDRHPRSEFLPAAQLKLAYSLLEIGEPDRAIAELVALREAWPESEEAMIAGHKLETLTGDSGSR